MVEVSFFFGSQSAALLRKDSRMLSMIIRSLGGTEGTIGW